MSTLERPYRLDALPEYAEYKDTGCDISPTCLACPLERCRWDGGHPHIVEYTSKREKAHVLATHGVPVEGIARILGVSKRQAFRYLETAPAMAYALASFLYFVHLPEE